MHDPRPVAVHVGVDRQEARVSGARTVILGLGNPILGDDAVGLLVAREVERQLGDRENIEILEATLCGFEVIDLLAGFRRAILVDAIKTPGGAPGAISRLHPDQLPTTSRLAAIHEINLPTALALGRRIGLDMPQNMVIYAIEVEDAWTFGENLSEAVGKAVRPAATRVVREVLAGREGFGKAIAPRGPVPHFAGHAVL